MESLQLNPNLTYQFIHVGHEHIPIVIIDDVVANPEVLVRLASDNQQTAEGYQHQHSDYYPGLRKNAPKSYQQNVCSALFAKMNSTFALHKGNGANVLLSAFSIATLPAEQLRPIQMLPHFDCPTDNQFAMVHYLCDAKHGGTSIYRHNLTGYERINESRQSEYRQLLKQQAIAEKLHLNPRYIDGDTCLFTRVHALEAKMNRAVIYPSNVLHSGNIRPEHGLSASPATGRLTISSFIVAN